MDDDTKADAPLTPDEEHALREAWAHIGAWEPWDGRDEGATYVCPLCGGEGETEGTILDATLPFPATLHPCGTGPGLAAAELVAGSTGRLLATLDEVRAERSVAKRAIDDLHRANQLGREVRQAAIERVIAARLERDEARRWASMYARSFGRLQSALRLSSEVPLEESVSRILALVGSEKLEPAQPSTPCAECALRDINGECSAQCVAAPAARSER